MPLELNRPVVRVTRGAYSTLYRRPKKIVVTLGVGDIITFREFRSKTTWSLPIDHAFKVAVRHKAFQDAAEKHRNKKKFK